MRQSLQVKAQLHKLAGCAAAVQLSFIFHNVSFITANPGQLSSAVLDSLAVCSECQGVRWPLGAFTCLNGQRDG